jgi:hypothetical protein
LNATIGNLERSMPPLGLDLVAGLASRWRWRIARRDFRMSATPSCAVAMRLAYSVTTASRSFGLLLALHASLSAAAPCADVSGRYRIDGFGPDLGDALEALQSSAAGFEDSGVELLGVRNSVLGIGIKSGRTGGWSPPAGKLLHERLDFHCKAGQLLLPREIESSRQVEGEWYEGSSVIALQRQSDRSLAVTVTFTGRQRISLFSYDSANVSIPKLGTRRVMTETIRWPVWRDSDTRPLPIPTPPEPAAALSVRQRLNSQVLGNMNLGVVDPSGEGALVTFTASRTEDVIAFEDRLRNASIGYDVERAPIWTNNAWYMAFLITPGPVGAHAVWRPSVLRISHEIERLAPVLVSVDSVEADADAYIATLSILPGGSLGDFAARIEAHSTVLADVEVIEESTRADAPKLRIARLRVHVR